MCITSNTVNQPPFEEHFSSAAYRLTPEIGEAARRQLGQHSLLHERGKPIRVVPYRLVAFYMGQHRNDARCPQFKDDALGLRDPGARPQLKQEVTTAVECGETASK